MASQQSTSDSAPASHSTPVGISGAADASTIAAARAYELSLPPPRFPLRLGLYQHYKNRELYHVTATVMHTENEGQELVCYKALYASPGNPENKQWVRPLDMFLEEVTNAVGQKVNRFQLVQADADADANEDTALSSPVTASVSDSTAAPTPSPTALSSTASVSSSGSSSASPAQAAADRGWSPSYVHHVW